MNPLPSKSTRERPMPFTLPSITIERTMPFTRLTSKRALEKALEAVPLVVTRPDEVRDAVQSHLRDVMAARMAKPRERQRPLLVLLGERHRSKTSLMMNLAAIAAVRDRNATVLLEGSSEHVDRLKQWALLLSVDLPDDPARASARINRGLSKATARFESTSQMLSALVAAHAGAEVGHIFDGSGAPPTRRKAYDLDDREQEMIRTIHQALAHGTGPVVVITGMAHMPKLHADFAASCDMAALWAAEYMDHPDRPDRRKRYRYLLSSDDIFKLRPAPQIDHQPFDANGYVARLGFDLHQPPARPLEPGSPWERGLSSWQRTARRDRAKAADSPAVRPVARPTREVSRFAPCDGASRPSTGPSPSLNRLWGSTDRGPRP